MYGQRRVACGGQVECGSVFMTNRTQAICLPKSMRLPDGVTSVDIVRRGRAWIIVPSNESWAEWFEGETVSDDFMVERGQPEAQEREAL
jgi:antitoxin VapB